MNGKTYIGLRERIAHAASADEVKTLLDEGSTYTQADDRTRRSWIATAARRIDELTGGGNAFQKEVTKQRPTVKELASVIGIAASVANAKGITGAQ